MERFAYVPEASTAMEVLLLLLDEIDDAVAAVRLRASRWLPFVGGTPG